ncbi:hypothetical protein [Pseudoalteromonas denitrificans]|uniref:Lipoprotein n=1 Tax=Pseudoalteromonas denitrificans DSM 6059 TaxID=1123010 RepID=A0A1I1V9N4_9GAMM|nr:hypothetical protein [Pseudoalteromonas denitrificans]SFD79697.1 hypothetical protein SAMN02745724_05451 [Pseudoalteromonas denitrificans DSM 6059]
MRNLIILMAFLATSCSLSELPYRKATLDNFVEFSSGHDFGYIDEKLKANLWRVKYIGIGGSSHSELKNHLLRRAGDLCSGKFEIQNYGKSDSVVAHRNPVQKPFVEANVLCG